MSHTPHTARPIVRRGLALLALAAVPLLLLGMAGCAAKPMPLTAQEHGQRMQADKSGLFENQEPLTGPLTLAEAISRALKHNFDNRLAMMEAVVQDKQFNLTQFNMLPRLAANAGWNIRSNELASNAISYNSRRETLEPSVSMERSTLGADLGLTWNIVDFGVSYYQAKQQADRILQANERRRRVVANIVKEVQGAYWKAATAQRLMPALNPVLSDAEKALETYRRIEEKRLQPVLTTLEQQKSALQYVNQLRKLSADMHMAKVQLASLVNLPLNQEYTVALPDLDQAAPTLRLSVEDLETLGLFYRPELRTEAYQERIDRNDARKELIKLLPGVALLGSFNYNSNKFYVHDTWAEAGVKATFNLFNLLVWPRQQEMADAQAEATRVKRLALTMATLVQVNVAHLQYQRALENYQTSEELNHVEERISKAVADAASVQAMSDLERVRRSVGHIAVRLEREKALAELYAAMANVQASIGYDPYYEAVDTTALAALTGSVSTSMGPNWQNTAIAQLQAIKEQQGGPAASAQGKTAPAGEPLTAPAAQ